MLIWLLLLSHAQTGVDAGPVQISCGGSVVTLAATITDPPANYVVQWEDAVEPGVFFVTAPQVTTPYRVFLTDLDTMTVYEDITWVNVHPGSSDLNGDSFFNLDDRRLLLGAWQGPIPNGNFDPDDDARITILDYFYICDFDSEPPNTPPTLVVNDVFTARDETVEVPYTINDAEQSPTLQIAGPAANGSVFLLGGILRYVPNPGFTGSDSFQLQVTDGFLTTPPRTVNVDVLLPDTWGNLYNEIFVIWCKACHIDAISGGLALNNYLSAQAGGVSGASFVAGFPDLSPLYLRVADNSMPEGLPPLSQADKERIFNWILRGAPAN